MPLERLSQEPLGGRATCVAYGIFFKFSVTSR
jgi:hypothetical protein